MPNPAAAPDTPPESDPETRPWWHPVRRLAAPIFVVCLVALSWSNYLDNQAATTTQERFTRALAVAALARVFNGIISVAQGTEVAIQPVGVGINLSVGEILDPLNDLVERFSALALIASASLGLQLTIANILATTWFTAAVTVLAALYLLVLALSRSRSSTEPERAQPWRAYLTRALATAIFVRFLFSVTLLVTHWIDVAFLAQIQDSATAQLTVTSKNIEILQTEQQDPQTPSQTESDFFDRTAQGLSRLLNGTAETLNAQKRLRALEHQVENSVTEIINLIIVFLLQTLIVPVLTLYLCWWALRGFWRGTGPT